MKKKILDQKQKKFLSLFADEKRISNEFYLSGGTALAEFYIPYRLSEDLDFFSEKEVEIDEIITFLKSIKKKMNFQDFEYNASYNRNLFFLKFSDKKELKLEFTYFPFSKIKEPKIISKVKIDSLEDIAANKLFTIYQKPRSRDFLDLYMICEKFGYSIEDLIKNAKIKFDTHIDLLKLGSQFLLAKELKDYPKLLEPIQEKDWQGFFIKEAERLGKKIIK